MAFDNEIVAAAGRYGIDPQIALAVAQRETGRRQFRGDGSLIVGGSGEIGIFQVMPSTAPGVNLADPRVNIDTGVRLLRDLYREFGSWPLALMAYNWGPGRLQDAIAGRRKIPGVVLEYVTAVLGPGAAPGGALPYSGTPVFSAGLTPASAAKFALGIFAAALVLMVLRN